jgi:lipoprotein-releasing system permease protein
VTTVSPALYSPTYFSGPLQAHGGALKGIDPDRELAVSTTLRHLKAGSVDRLRDPNASPPAIILGSRLAEDTGMVLNSNVDILTDQLTPMGPRPVRRRFRVAGLFETGFFDVDDNWAYTSIGAAQRALGTDQINQIELNVDDLNRAGEVAKEVEKVAGPRYTTTTWMERNRQLLGALNMERVVVAIVISLIELVAALNIFITLVMMVMEKYRDIAILMSMGAKLGQIRRIFMLQGVLIGAVGSAIGLVAGYAIAYFANRYQWIPLDETIYSMRFVPFEPRFTDAFWIAGLALLVSFLATLYPARNATRITPAEVLRYE